MIKLLPGKPRQIRRRPWLTLLLAGLLLSAAACQQGKPDPDQTAGSVAYYTCPMHSQIHADAPGDCPICHMHLVAVSPLAAQKPAAGAPAAASYTCPMHAQIHADKPGDCPICGMALVKTSARPAAQKMTAAEMAAMPGGPAAGTDLVLTAQQVALGNIQTQQLGSSTPRGATAPPVPAPQAVLTGTVTANTQRTESISSRVAGRVEQLYVRQTGQVLRRGAPLFAVYSEELQTLQREYLLALTQDLQVAEPTYRHFAEATAQKLRLLGVSGAQLRQLARSGKSSPLVTYYSPRTGTVQTLAVVQGQYVAEGSPLLTLTDLSSVWVEAQLYPAEAGRLPLGQTVAVQVAGLARPVRGKVVFLSPELSGSSQLTLARIEVPNPAGRLQPGAQANVLLDAAPAPAALPTATSASTTLRVPPAAIIYNGALSYVWKQTGERQFRRVRVRLGEGTATALPVLAGLQAGDAVVTTGAYLLESEFTLRQGAGDDHMSGMAM
ncbi:efflux RND transporter periplasmic adaptor subunit [Hymenobacter caeli]|uniref:Cu(I)/Ag(I) efflux system membrane fusion protein n=1 Tax=Hymenobacter caeli TaxID=2735894 RepID=A0ABX2FUY4_9BACT|nr:efflux RND transporter periplasmic adaptor subunit [Hymenobacter caeli]NRT21000.1 Cu(I)/Ag(I) efflux system membrane fusion protein [Hymenobacter caeli]